MPPVQIIYAQMQQDRLDSVRRNLLRVLPIVDRAVIVDNGSTDGTREWLRGLSPKVLLVEREWNDSFVEGRNAYLRAIDRLADDAEATVICVADDDELYSDALLQDLRGIVEEMYLEDLNSLRVRSQSVETDWKGDVHWSQMDEWHKPLIMLWEPGIRYRGIGQSEVHEDLILPSGRREKLLQDQGKYWYDHVKKHGAIWLRATRNFFAGGGGPNLGERNPLWRPFQSLFAKYGITTSDQMQRYLQAGGIDQAIKDWFVHYRHFGTERDPTPPMWAEWPDGTSEVREGFQAYFVYLRPEEMPPDIFYADLELGIDHRPDTRVIHGPASPAWAAY